jgi:E1-E2 ATPase
MNAPAIQHNVPPPYQQKVDSGTAATYGRGKAVVTATGMQTEMGRIAGMLKEAPDETTPLQKELDRVGKRPGIVVVIIAVVMIATIILVENVRGFSAFFDVLILGVALAVAAVPEGLPAVVTAVLALGVQRMAKRNAIVDDVSTLQRFQRALGRANRLPSSLSKPLVIGCGQLVASAPCRGDLHSISSKRLFDRGPDSPRLAALRRSGELGSLAARVEQAVTRAKVKCAAILPIASSIIMSLARIYGNQGIPRYRRIPAEAGFNSQCHSRAGPEGIF